MVARFAGVERQLGSAASHVRPVKLAPYRNYRIISEVMEKPNPPAPPAVTLDDLDPEMATTDRLIARVRSHRDGEECLTADRLY